MLLPGVACWGISLATPTLMVMRIAPPSNSSANWDTALRMRSAITTSPSSSSSRTSTQNSSPP